ncbi:MAG: glutamate 5-kinase [Verrucomicrobiota bacterium]
MDPQKTPLPALPRRVVLKLGTRILTRPDGVGLDLKNLQAIVAAVVGLANRGVELLVVSSGAVGAGLFSYGKKTRPEDLAALQALAAVGQSRLMHHYEQAFRQHDCRVGQLLLTYHDLDSPERRQRILATLEALLTLGKTIPVINENDSVATEELSFGDNDLLSSRVAELVQADLLVLFTSVEGLHAPGAEGDPLVESVPDVTRVLHYARQHDDPLSRGGMQSKLKAVEAATRVGIPVVMAHGRHPEQLPALLAGQGRGTRFSARRTPS